MGLFKKKVKKQEQIDLSINENIINDEIMEDTPKVLEISNEEMLNIIKSKYESIQKNNEQVIHDYYVCKIFSRVGIKDLDFNLQVIALDKHIDKLKRDIFYLSNFLKNINNGLNILDEEIKKYYNEVKDIEGFQIGLLNQLKEINNNSYRNLRMSTVTVCLNKTNKELEELYNNIAHELEGFKNYNEASEYIFYNSGAFIEDMIKSILTYIKDSKVKNQIDLYNWKYFISYDAIISLEYSEWIALYNKVKFVMKKVIKYNEKKYIELVNKVMQFESKYAILMMNYDGKSGK